MPGPSPQDNLALFSFAEYSFPVEEYEVIGGLRDHVHEYSHQDGGDPEKLGRRLYVVRCTGNFQAKFARYPGLWPDALNSFTKLWETGAVAPLVVPSIGTIQAYAFGWTRKFSAKIRSGEKCAIEFREDSTNLPLPINVTLPSPQSLQSGASLAAANAARANLGASDMGLIQSLQSAVAGLQAIEDTAYLYGNQVLLQCQELISLCQQIDQLDSVQSANNAELMRNIHDVWAQAQQYASDLQQQNVTLQQFITPVQMSIGAVSTAIFGDATHAADLLALNTGSFNDPMLIPAATIIAYYPATSARSTAGNVALGVAGV